MAFANCQFKPEISIYFGYFSIYEQFKFNAQLSWESSLIKYLVKFPNLQYLYKMNWEFWWYSPILILTWFKTMKSDILPKVMRNRLFAYAKTKTQISFAVTVKLISAFVFTTRTVQSPYFLNPKFQASSYLLWLYSPVCVGPGRKPRRPVFSQRGSIVVLIFFTGPENGEVQTTQSLIMSQMARRVRELTSRLGSEHKDLHSAVSKVGKAIDRVWNIFCWFQPQTSKLKFFFYIWAPSWENWLFCICENKDADQLHGNREADRRLCFLYMDSAVSLVSKSEISSLSPLSVAIQPGLCRTWPESQKTGFLTTRLIYMYNRREVHFAMGGNFSLKICGTSIFHFEFRLQCLISYSVYWV